MQTSGTTEEVSTSTVMDGFSYIHVLGIPVAITFEVLFSLSGVSLRLASPDVSTNPDDALYSDCPEIIEHWREIVRRIHDLAQRQAAGPQAWGTTLRKMGLE